MKDSFLEFYFVLLKKNQTGAIFVGVIFVLQFMTAINRKENFPFLNYSMYSHKLNIDTLECDVIYINGRIFNSFELLRTNDNVLHYSLRNLKEKVKDDETNATKYIEEHGKWFTSYIGNISGINIRNLKVENRKLVKIGNNYKVVEIHTIYETK